MSFQRYNNNNIINNHSKKILEFQKSIDDMQHFNNKLESKIKNLVNDFNETITNINNMFVNKSFDTNITIKNNFNKSTIPQNSSPRFGESLAQLPNDIIAIGNPEHGSIDLYHKNQYDHYKESQVIKPHNTVENFGKSLAVYEDIIVTSGMTTDTGYIYIYYKNQDNLWEKYQIIEISFDNMNKLNVEIYGDTIVANYDSKLVIIEKTKEGIWEKIQNIENISLFSLYDKILTLYVDKDIIVYEKDTEWQEMQSISFEHEIQKLYLCHTKLLISTHNVIELYEKDTLGNWDKVQTFNINGMDFKLNKDTLVIASVKGIMNPLVVFDTDKCNTVLYIYKKNKNNEWINLRKMPLDDMKMELQTSLSLQNNDIVIGNYYKTNNESTVYVINEYDANIKWKGELMTYMNKTDLNITVEYN